MALNLLWIIFFLMAFITALVRLIFFGDTEIFKTIIDGVFDSAGTSVQIAIGLIGVMALFLGFHEYWGKGRRRQFSFPHHRSFFQ